MGFLSICGVGVGFVFQLVFLSGGFGFGFGGEVGLVSDYVEGYFSGLELVWF